MSIVTFGLGNTGGTQNPIPTYVFRFGHVTDVLLVTKELDAEVESVDIREADIYTPELTAELDIPYLDAELADGC
jgi:hypothetical protein